MDIIYPLRKKLKIKRINYMPFFFRHGYLYRFVYREQVRYINI
jgi:hypothetical protein